MTGRQQRQKDLKEGAVGDAPRPKGRSPGAEDAAAQLEKLFRQAALEQGPAACLVAADGTLLYENAAFQRIKRALAAAGALPGRDDRPPAKGPQSSRVTLKITHRHELFHCRALDLAVGKTAARGYLFEPVAQDGCTLAEVGRLTSKLEDLTRLVSDWVWETDRDLDFTALSARSLDILGRHPQELLGTSLMALPERPGAAFLSTLQDGCRTPFRDLEIDVRHANGDMRHLRLCGLPVYDQLSGDFVGLRGTAADVTAMRQRERDLIDSKESAELANRTKTEFLANMSHELRTPLNAVIGFAEIMESELLGPLGSAQYRSYAEDIHTSAEHLLNLINDILDISKIEAGSHQLYREEVDAKEMLDSVCRLIQDRCMRAGVTLVRNFESDLPRIFVDERKIKQVLLNLLANATKYTPKGGEIAVTAGRVQGGAFEFTVSDSGVGIAAADMKAAFTPFEQIANAENQKSQGTGLGLPLSRGFMRLHGGDLILESALGQGTTATARLPENCVLPNAGAKRQSA